MVVTQSVPSPWKVPPPLLHSLTVRSWQVSPGKQQAPDNAGGVKSTVSLGRRLSSLNWRLLKRLAVLEPLSSASRTIQPWLVDGKSSQPWMSAAICKFVQL